MSGQMNLLAPPAEGAVEVPICPEVLLRGAEAHSRAGEPLFAHRHLPPLPDALAESREWLAALDFAEEARRSNQVPCAKLDLTQGSGSGYSGYMGRGGPNTVSLTASSRGIEVGDGPDKRVVRWPALLRGRAEQREVEPEVGRARDLAEAFHYLDYYGRVYADLPWGEDWTPLPLIRRLAAEVRELGGDPTLLDPHTDYMREGIGG